VAASTPISITITVVALAVTGRSHSSNGQLRNKAQIAKMLRAAKSQFSGATTYYSSITNTTTTTTTTITTTTTTITTITTITLSPPLPLFAAE